MACDVQLNIRFAFENLHRGGRFCAGHSSNAIFCGHIWKHSCLDRWTLSRSWPGTVLAEKIMAMYGHPVEAYIFNPPISLISQEQLVESEALKCVVRLIRDIVKAGIARVLDLNEETSFVCEPIRSNLLRIYWIRIRESCVSTFTTRPL
ncbi:unnamed protein product [Arabidopsis halleri]